MPRHHRKKVGQPSTSWKENNQVVTHELGTAEGTCQDIGSHRVRTHPSRDAEEGIPWDTG